MTLVGHVGNREVMHGGLQGTRGKSLYFLLKFAVNLKLP